MTNYHMSPKDFLVGAVVGSLLGTASALLMAPKSGKRLRQDISDVCCDISEKAQDATYRMGKKSRSFMKNLSSQTSDWGDRAKDVVDDVKGGMKDWVHPEEASRDLLIGGLAGGILGAVVGLLVAPKSGSELRHDIVEGYEEFTDKTQDVADRLTKKGKSVAQNVQSQAGDWIDIAKQLLDQITGEARETVENVAEKGKEQFQSNRIHDVMEWASFGVRLWQGMKKRR